MPQPLGMSTMKTTPACIALLCSVSIDSFAVAQADGSVLRFSDVSFCERGRADFAAVGPQATRRGWTRGFSRKA